MTCACGCGTATKTVGAIWAVGHHTRVNRPTGPRRSSHKVGARRLTRNGYVRLKTHIGGRSRHEHVIVPERALGHALPARAQIHHVDEDGTNNQNRNLVICQDHAYHKALHARRRVFLAGGRPFLDLWCATCQQPRPRTEFYANSICECKTCHRYGQRQRYIPVRLRTARIPAER